MNKLFKIIIASLGGLDIIFSIFIPTFVALLIIGAVELSQLNQLVVIITGLLSTLYRALSNITPIILE